MNSHVGIREVCRGLALGFMIWGMLAWTGVSRAAVLWSDLGNTQVHETGMGTRILSGDLHRDDSSADTLYFKFHVDPLSDASKEEYLAAFQLFEENKERLAVGNGFKAWAYSAFAFGETQQTNRDAYIDLNSAKPDPSGVGTFFIYELPHRGIERTIVFKVQYIPNGDDQVTVWLDPDLRPGATETNQLESLTTRFKANASFDEIRLRHHGGGEGWVFSEMAITTSFEDFVNANGTGVAGVTSGFQPEQMPFTFRSWQREQGLSQNYVRALAQTRDGYLWVGSDDGVSRFDGVRFLSFGISEGFKSGPVQALLGDSRGALWIGSVDGGLSCWTGVGQPRSYTMSNGLPSDSITALAEDSKGRLWVGTAAGLVVFQGGRLTTPSGADVVAGKNITTLFCDRKGTMWVGATGAGIFSCQEDKFVRLRDREPSLDALLQDPHCLLVDQAGRLWVGAGDASVLCRQGERWQRYGIPRHLVRRYISALAEEPNGTVWAGSVSEGLLQFSAGKLAAFNASSGLSDDLVEALLVDREGKLWVGTHGGLNRLRPRNLSTLYHNEGLGYGVVQGLAEVRPGIIWATKPGEGVYRWDGQRFNRLLLSGLVSQEPRVNALLTAWDGSSWAAGSFGLLQFKNPETAGEIGGVLTLTNLTITALGQDLNGGLWAGTRDGELWQCREGQWCLQTNCPRNHALTAIVPGSNGSLWVGTEGDGLYKFQGDSRTWARQSGLPSEWIRTAYMDAQRTLWVGTAGGLSRLRGSQINNFTTREGLPDNIISQILEDNDGNLWLGGNRGIVRVKKSDLEDLAEHKVPAVYPQVYGRAEGMLSEECTSGFSPAGLKTKADLLLFSTLEGIVVVDPRHTVSAPAPAVVLEQTLVDGSDLDLRAAGAVNGSPTPDSDKEKNPAEFLRLPPGKHRLEFRYTGLSFDAPERVRFRYRLEGLDPDWVEAGTRRTAFYGFVPPGHYCFRVIACNGDGVWNEEGARLNLTVLTHFWQTWWFIGASVLTLVIGGAGGARVVEKRRLHNRLKRLEQERALERERTRIAQDLHDMMGAKLCRISFLTEHARRSQTVPDELQEQFTSISDDSREVLRSLDEIVWAVNPRNDTLENLASYIGQFAQEYFRRTGIECILVMPAQLPIQPLSSQSRHHLFLAVHEALTNILKHSGATQAKVTMICRSAEFEIVISDNGAGFDPVLPQPSSPISTGFGRNGLGNMRQRLTDLGGSCVVESCRGRGTLIRFVLPLKVSIGVK